MVKCEHSPASYVTCMLHHLHSGFAFACAPNASDGQCASRLSSSLILTVGSERKNASLPLGSLLLPTNQLPPSSVAAPVSALSGAQKIA